MISGKGKNFFSREKRFFPFPEPLSLFKKSEIFCSRWSRHCLGRRKTAGMFQTAAEQDKTLKPHGRFSRYTLKITTGNKGKSAFRYFILCPNQNHRRTENFIQIFQTVPAKPADAASGSRPPCGSLITGQFNEIVRPGSNSPGLAKSRFAGIAGG